MANVLSSETQTAVVAALAEGNSIRSIERMTSIHRDTIMRLGVRVGEGCSRIMDETMRGLDCRLIQLDEIWGFVGKKNLIASPQERREGKGDVWTWVAIDAESRMVPVFHVGKRSIEDAEMFVGDLASRLDHRVQITSDNLSAYRQAVEAGFGGEVDFAQLVKAYGADHSDPATRGKYSPAKLLYSTKEVRIGNPDEDLISTSYVERQNLTMRMHMRRLTRLTNAFSKKLENFKAAVALHFGYYNFVKQHGTIGTTPAQAGGVTDHAWTLPELIYNAQ